MSHPDPATAPDLRPFRVGDVLENPVTRESARILELPDGNPDRRTKAELLAVVGPRVVGEHLHPVVVERFTVIEGELTVRLDGVTSLLHEGETAEVRPGQWHDWWTGADRDARVLVEVTPGDRFGHMIETMFGLARLGYVNDKGMPKLLQMAMIGREFSDTVQFRSPPPAVQKAVFAVLAPDRARDGVPRDLPATVPQPGNRRHRLRQASSTTAARHHFSMKTWMVPPQVSPTSKASSSAMP